MSDTVLVIGGGIAGIQASLDLADAGVKVILVEKSPAIGGKMAALDKNFPTLDCSICIEAPKMSDVMHNPNITVLTLAEVKNVTGRAGNFEVEVYQRPRFVTSECTACNLCVDACPQITKNEFDMNLAARKAIYTPFSQAEPNTYVIDIDTCLNKPPNYLPCNRCTEACGPGAIDFSMKPRTYRFNVGSIIVATGFDLLNPELLQEFGYGRDPDVLSSYEFERLLNPAGPTEGELIRPSDKKHIEKLLFVLCAGSRDQRYVPYCSRTCCMYSIKEAIQAKDHGIRDVSIFYMDIRAYGKGFDAFYERSKNEGIRYVRSRPRYAGKEDGRIKIRYEDTSSGNINYDYFDAVVLATASIPSRGTKELSKALGIELNEYGFFRTSHRNPVESTREGIFIAGCASGPKDIPDSVTEASAAAAAAQRYVTKREWIEMEKAEPLTISDEPRIGVFLCDCGTNIAGVVNVAEVAEKVKSIPNVVYVEENKYTCAGSTQDNIVKKIREHNINRVIVAACSLKTHGVTFQRVLSRAGLNPYLLEMPNIRNLDSWVHKNEKENATRKAYEMILMSAYKSRYLMPLQDLEFPVTKRALIIGGGPAGLSSAIALARTGIETHLIEREERLGGMLNDLRHISPYGIDPNDLLNYLIDEARNLGVRLHLSTTVKKISGFIGNFNVILSDNESIDVGAVIIATGAEPYVPSEFGYGKDERVVTTLDLEKNMNSIKENDITIISCIGSRSNGRGCSRFCCSTMMNQAIKLREMGKRVRILYKDIRTYSLYAEDLYLKASRMGVQFFRYDPDSQPENAIRFENGRIILRDQLTGDDLSIPTELLVLNIGLSPRDDDVFSQLTLSKDENGFLLELHPKLGPVENAIAGVYLAGTSQGPKDVYESMVQGYAAASKAAALLFKDRIRKEPIVASIDTNKCIKCMRCVNVCPYGALTGELTKWIKHNPALCQGCGDCVAECPVDAITIPNFTDRDILAQIDAATEVDPDKKIIVFACNWCSYAGADLAGISKIQYPSSARLIRVMCSSRISQKLVMHAFERGAAAVAVTGCHIGDCHYNYANRDTEKRFERWRKFLQARNINPERLQLYWVSAAEGIRFAQFMRRMDEFIKTIPKEELESTPKKLRGSK
ncbi:MAG: hydrogenase iron-sulfur subunit [Thermoplasmata archaeon]